MKISGLQKLTLLDYPGKMAAILFVGGCNFRCPFCHNSDLVLLPEGVQEIAEEEIFSFLNKRKGILDGVVISGGEPLLYEETLSLMKKIKEMGYFVKLDTNGSFPERLKRAVNEGLCDYVAMDIKNSKEKYAITCGKENIDISPIEDSVEFLKEGKIPYEFRTTVACELHTTEDMKKIGRWLSGADKYFIQPYRDSEGVLSPGLTTPKKEESEEFKTAVSPFITEVYVRGE